MKYPSTARPWRIEYEGVFYHVLSRENKRRKIISHDKGMTLFLKLLSEMFEKKTT